jgi:hypothetical protein
MLEMGIVDDLLEETLSHRKSSGRFTTHSKTQENLDDRRYTPSTQEEELCEDRRSKAVDQHWQQLHEYELVKTLRRSGKERKNQHKEATTVWIRGWKL